MRHMALYNTTNGAHNLTIVERGVYVRTAVDVTWSC